MAGEARNQRVEAVDKAIKVLSVFKSGDTPLDLGELARRTGFHKSTLLRLLRSLEEGGLINRLPDKTYGIGSMAIRLASIYQRMYRLEQHVRPVLRRLVSETGESASFYRREGEQRLCLVRENSEHALREHVLEGEMRPLSKGASAQVLLKFADVKAPHIPPKLASSIPFFSFEEFNKGISGAAVPVFGQNGKLEGALTLTGPLTRLTEDRLKHLSQLLVDAANEVSLALGAPLPNGVLEGRRNSRHSATAPMV